ncbi:hypothetical protein GCM10010842_28340 [Deinococcus daejeonensis]|uniref:Uncharacterized protein n=1 Tax=Deinococcus daejeonensis TaxID=1007098 RepID=A0ABQ2J9G0_9DEIO|nr:hypothetical protein GCM10010842_28340 [Deinococcus daejeonensis]
MASAAFPLPRVGSIARKEKSDMAKWKQIVLESLDTQGSKRPFDVFNSIVAHHSVDKETLRDALMLLISSGDVIVDSNLGIKRA